jgi:hypothetical protein
MDAVKEVEYSLIAEPSTLVRNTHFSWWGWTFGNNDSFHPNYLALSWTLSR